MTLFAGRVRHPFTDRAERVIPAYSDPVLACVGQKKVITMRVLMKATMDTEKANEAIRSGKMPEMMRETLDMLKPEAAYFGAIGGKRTALLVLDMQDSSEMPPTGEPFFMQLNAEIEVCPIMNADDLQRGLSQLR